MKTVDLMRLPVFETDGRQPDNFLEIILTLANRGPLIKNEIANALGAREGDVSKRVDWLLSTGFLSVFRLRTKVTRFRTIELKEYRPTLKGVFAISHMPSFNPMKTMSFYPEIPPVVRELILSFGADRVKLYINKLGNRVKKSVDDTPSFEDVTSLDALFMPLLRFGIEELPNLTGGSALTKDTQERMQKVLIDHSDTLVKWIDQMTVSLTTQADALRAIRESLIDAKKQPTKIREIFSEQKTER